MLNDNHSNLVSFLGEVPFCEFLVCFPIIPFLRFFLVSLRNLSSCEGSNCEV